MKLLGTVERTAGDVTHNAATWADVTGISITATTKVGRCLILVTVSGKSAGASNNIALDIDIDGTREGGDYGSVIGLGTNNKDLSFQLVTDVLTAGEHTFKLKMRSESTVVSTVFASTAVCPLKMAVFEIDG